MKSVFEKVLVTVDMNQKDFMTLGDSVVRMAQSFSTNYRERSPVLGRFAETNKFFREGDVAVFHHNHFYHPSPYHLYDDLFSVPMNKTIFGTIDSHGEMTPVMGNMICERIPVKTPFPVPPDQQEYHTSQYLVVNPGWTTYKINDIIFTRPASGYEIVYTWDGIEKKILKVSEDMVCGVLKK